MGRSLVPRLSSNGVVLNALVSTFLEIITPFASIGTGVLAAYLTSARSRTLAKEQRVIEDNRRNVDWDRQRQAFSDERHKENEMFVAQIEAQARTEVRTRAHQHAEALIGPLWELQGVVADSSHTKSYELLAMLVSTHKIFSGMKIDVAYQDVDLRERFDILFHVFDAIASDTYPYPTKYDFRFLLKHVSIGTLDSLMARLRGESLPPLNAEQILVQDLYRTVQDFEEAEIRREIAEAEAQVAYEKNERHE